MQRRQFLCFGLLVPFVPLLAKLPTEVKPVVKPIEKLHICYGYDNTAGRGWCLIKGHYFGPYEDIPPELKARCHTY